MPGAVGEAATQALGRQHYQIDQARRIGVLSETEFYDDLAAIDVPVLVMHGEDDQICPFPTTGARSVKLLKHGLSRPAARHADHPCRYHQRRPARFYPVQVIVWLSLMLRRSPKLAALGTQIGPLDRFARLCRSCLIPRRRVDLVVMHLAFLAARRDRHADALAGIGATGGAVPAFLIGVDQVAIFAVHHTCA
jgi:hypothetical protein